MVRAATERDMLHPAQAASLPSFGRLGGILGSQLGHLASFQIALDHSSAYIPSGEGDPAP